MDTLLEIRRRAQAAEAVQPPPAGQAGESEAAPAGALERETGPTAGGYQAMYHAALDYLTRHHPPRPGADYWVEAASNMDAMARSWGNKPLMNGLLCAAYAELEREHKRLLEG